MEASGGEGEPRVSSSSSTSVNAMTEGWEDCRLLGPGWKRREVFRKSGATCGKADTYYQSPTGEKFRSKIEMMKYLGSSVNLALFDYKNGLLMAPEEVQTRKRKRSVGPGQDLKAKMPKVPVPVPAPPDGVSTTSDDGTMIVCCEGCKAWFSGVMFGKQKLVRWFCGGCKAERRAFMKEQRFYKTVGCGACAACQLPEDCASCTVCLLRAQNPEFGTMWKCVKRRCLKIVKKKWNPPSERDINNVPRAKPKVKTKKLSLHVQKGTLPQGTALEGTAPQGTAAQGTAPQGTALQGIVPPGTAPQGTAPQGTAPQGTAPQGIVPHGIVPQGIVPQGIVPQGIAPQGTVPRVTTPQLATSHVTPPVSTQKDIITGPIIKYKKKNGCGMCQPCRVTEDCGACWTCIKKRTDPERKVKRQWKCAKRRCLRKKKIQQINQQKLKQRIQLPEPKTFVQKEHSSVASKEEMHFAPKTTQFPPKETNIAKEVLHIVPKTTFFGPKEKMTFAPEKTHVPEKMHVPEKTHFLSTEENPFANQEKIPVPKETSHFVPKEKKRFVSKEKKSFFTKKLTVKWKLPFDRERDSSSLQMAKLKKKQQLRAKVNEQKLSLKRHLANRRNNRKCGECEACVQKVDCGRCDFCRDKPKFGGRNLKRQKCRWRQCLRFAMEKNIPAVLKRIKQERGEGLSNERDDGLSESSSDQEYDANGFSSDQSFSSDSTQHIKQEMVETNGACDDTLPISLVHKDHPLPSNIDEVLIEGNMAEADESTPVIMEIFSLGSYQAFSRLDNVLREFLNELNEIPLPAHWEVLPLDSPNLQLVQRSKQSTMADTVIHIQPGLYFQITVCELYVPTSHELFANHPCRLTTVDDVVELICDLEAYRLCAGPPKTTTRSPTCEILVYRDRCPQCCLSPWPSGTDL